MMPVNSRDQIVRLSDQLVPELVAPPQEGPGICVRCRTWNDAPDELECSNCAEVRRELGIEPIPISLISLYRKPSALRDWLTQYKGRPDDNEPFVPEYQDIVTALLGRFFLEHGCALYQRLNGYDAAVIVPSTSREPPHPLEALVGLALPSVPVLRLLRRGSGDLGFRRPAKDGYMVTENPSSYGRLLLIDDVYTTGSRLNSASFTLHEAGADVAGGFVIARRINVEFDPRAKELWDRQSAETFSWLTSPVLATASLRGVSKMNDSWARDHSTSFAQGLSQVLGAAEISAVEIIRFIRPHSFLGREVSDQARILTRDAREEYRIRGYGFWEALLSNSASADTSTRRAILNGCGSSEVMQCEVF